MMKNLSKILIMLFLLEGQPAAAGTYQIYYDAGSHSIYSDPYSTPTIDATYYRNLIVSYQTRFVGATFGYFGAKEYTSCNGTQYGNGTNVISVSMGWSAGSAAMATWMPSCSLKPVVFTWDGDGWWNSGPNEIKEITVTGIKDPPTATGQTVSVSKYASVNITPIMSDPQNAPMTVAVVTPPSRGTVSWDGTKFIYTHQSCLLTSDSFQYRAVETIQNQQSSTVTVTINVNNADYPPSVALINNLRIPWYTPGNVSLAVTPGLCGGTLAITATSSNTAVFPNPTVNYTSPNTSGSLTITPVRPVAGQIGTSTVTLQLNDGVNSQSTRTFDTTVEWVNLFHGK